MDISHLVMSALAGKSDGGADDSQCSMFDYGPDVNEEALIDEKTEFEKAFIKKLRSIFSEGLSPYRFIKSLPMEINLKDNPNCSNDPSLYRFKP